MVDSSVDHSFQDDSVQRAIVLNRTAILDILDRSKTMVVRKRGLTFPVDVRIFLVEAGPTVKFVPKLHRGASASTFAKFFKCVGVATWKGVQTIMACDLAKHIKLIAETELSVALLSAKGMDKFSVQNQSRIIIDL